MWSTLLFITILTMFLLATHVFHAPHYRSLDAEEGQAVLPQVVVVRNEAVFVQSGVQDQSVLRERQRLDVLPVLQRDTRSSLSLIVHYIIAQSQLSPTGCSCSGWMSFPSYNMTHALYYRSLCTLLPLTATLWFTVCSSVGVSVYVCEV